MAVLGTAALIAFTADSALGLITKGTMIYKGKSLLKKRDWRDIMEGGDDELSFSDYQEEALELLKDVKIPKKKREEIKKLLPEEVKEHKTSFNDILSIGKSLWGYRKVIKVCGKVLIDNPKIVINLALTQEHLEPEHKEMIARVYAILMKINKRRERL